MFVAVLRLRHGQSGPELRRIRAPGDFDVLLDTAQGGGRLLQVRVQGEDVLGQCLRAVAGVDKRMAQRAVPIPMCLDTPSSSLSTPTHLACIPLLGDLGGKLDVQQRQLRFCNLAYLANLAVKRDKWLESQSSLLVQKLEEWVAKQQFDNPDFLSDLFGRRPAPTRIRACVHNPAYSSKYRVICKKQLSPDVASTSTDSCDLIEDVGMANSTRILMVRMDKCEKCVVNPAYGALGSAQKRNAPKYYVADRVDVPGSPLPCTSPPVDPALSFEQRFPLHNAAFHGNYIRVKELLEQGADPNQLDGDQWTPLHYATFYNRLEACQQLMLSARIDVNVENKTGATALHFAALNGHTYLVELMLSHAQLDPARRDGHGRTALDLCERVPRPEWRRAARLLRNAAQLRPRKVEVHLIGGTSLQVRCDLAHVTAGQLRDMVLDLEGVALGPGRKVFALWMCSDRLSLQLKAEMKVGVHLDKWAGHVERWGESGAFDQTETPRLVLKRDARTLLGDELGLARQSSASVRLLYGEAERQFLSGRYPCKDKDAYRMAAIILRLLYGAKPTGAMDPSVLNSCLPLHLIPDEAKGRHKLLAKLQDIQSQLGPKSPVPQLQFDFLQACWKLNLYGCTFFKVNMHRNKAPFESAQVLLGLNDWGVSVISCESSKQVQAAEMAAADLHQEVGQAMLTFTQRSRSDAYLIETRQAHLIAMLFKQLKEKVTNAPTKR